MGGTGTGTGDAPCATIKKDRLEGAAPAKSKEARGKSGATQGRSVRVRGVLVRRSGGTMRVAWGRGAAHGVEEDNASAGSFTTAGALREAIPPPCRQGESNPKPCRPSGRRAARPTAYFVRPESHTTCSDDVGHVDFQLQSAACSRCSTPGSVRWGSMLSMVPAKPMVSKKPTPPVQNIETWATFESREPLKGRPELFASGQNYRCSEVGR